VAQFFGRFMCNANDCVLIIRICCSCSMDSCVTNKHCMWGLITRS